MKAAGTLMPVHREPHALAASLLSLIKEDS